MNRGLNMEIFKDLMKKAMDPEWMEIHRQMGFATSLADLIVLDEELHDEELDGETDA